MRPTSIPGLREAALILAVMALIFTSVILRPDRGREPVSPDLRLAEMGR